MPATTLRPTPPFDLDLTANHQTYYQTEFGADHYLNGVYSRALFLEDRPVLALARTLGNMTSPLVSVEVAGDGASPRLAELAAGEVSRMLTMNLALQPFYDSVRDDPFLGEATTRMRGLHPPQTGSVYEALVMAVIGQQISGVVARAIRARVVKELGTPFSADGGQRFTFPQPESFLAAGVERLRGLGLSARKVEYIQGIAATTLEGGLDHERISTLTNQEVVDELTRLRGVGQWTAQWVLLRALARPDAFPAGDLALQRLMSEVYFGGRKVGEKEAADFAHDRWGPFSGLATTYMFAYIRRRRVLQEQREVVQGA
ncbi:MAG: DNA-3-methyladenine glycosylase 2 family protein [Chloroflexi bacterium]|nr:DNA-3-methyladenine glycosylase 2 family protein [Chloroflexota bacterium]